MAWQTWGELSPGATIELWARASRPVSTAVFVIRAGEQRVFEIGSPPPYFEHSRFTNLWEQPLTVHLDPEQLEVSLAYHWHPESLPTQGIRLLPATGDSPEARPELHFSPPRQWMNDPNGLHYQDGHYHLFYQFHPNSSEWGPMHWGHAVSRDLFNWVHYPVFLHPEKNLLPLGATGGAFSGSACTGHDGRLRFYYTERLPAYDLHKDYREVQKRVIPAADGITPDAITTVISERPDGVDCDFRDPKVWYDDASEQYLMILGAALHGDPAVLLYTSRDGEHWHYRGPLYVAPPQFKDQGARCIECPDLLPLNGRWVLYMGFVGHQDPETGRHNLMYYQVGQFDPDQGFLPEGPLREVDFGTDFYAMQSFLADDRRLAIAWLFNWAFQKPPGSDYCGEMSLPRQLSLNAEKRLCMHPILSGLISRSLPLVAVSPVRFRPGDNPCLLTMQAADGDIRHFRIAGVDARQREWSVTLDDGLLRMVLPEDRGDIDYVHPLPRFSDLSLLYDRGIIELFVNGGSVCGTRRSYQLTELSSLTIDTTHAPEALSISAETLTCPQPGQ
ncbi:glycoside hydrolase family 32 protein [Natronospirillum operosum]|nr:glycoside hydrolase family 32 protein [Natronospirillum operosum]